VKLRAFSKNATALRSSETGSAGTAAGNCMADVVITVTSLVVDGGDLKGDR